MYFVLRDLNNSSFELVFLQHITLNSLKHLNEYSKFLDWWDLICFKLENYETESKKISLLIILNSLNIQKAFNVSEEEVVFLKPIHPWNKQLLDYINYENNTIEKLKHIIRSLKNKNK